MFTGIVEVFGKIEKRTAAALSVRADVPKPKLGASIAINGCCLTVVETRNGVHRFDVGPDTWARTNLGALKAGDRVNVEPSLKVGAELGGHFVTGHVDAGAEVIFFRPWSEGFRRLRAELPKNLRGLVAVKGSIAVDGVSLTVTAAGKDFFEVMLVPHTLSSTTLGGRKPGDRVNLEADPLARYAANAVRTLGKAR